MKWPECGFRFFNPAEDKPNGTHVFRVCEKRMGHSLRKKWMPHEGRIVTHRLAVKGPEGKWQ